MIRVHEEQLGALERTLGLERFEDEMVVHLRGFSPRHSEVIGDDCVRRAIRLGIERARRYDVTNPGLLRFYVELMIMFGSMFDIDPLHPWAGAILRDPDIPNEAVRIDRLYDGMLEYLDAVKDPEDRFPLQAVHNLAQFLGEDIPPAELRVEQKALDTLARVYPQRCAYLGESRLVELIRRGPEASARHDMATDRGVVVAVGMMFGLGPGFAEDPLYPWVQATLCDPAIKSPERRAERLQKRTQIYLTRAIKYIEARQVDVVL